MTVSRHLLRRTARRREHHLERMLKTAAHRGWGGITLEDGRNLPVGTRLKTEPTIRGPFGWRVVTY